MYRVLVVDDEIISRMGISSLIDWNENGFILVDSVSNGLEALEHLRNDPVDMVITDIMMPVMNGIELIKKAKEENISCEFVVLSSFDDYAFVREALKLGALDYILKLDLDAGQLINVLEKARDKIASKERNTVYNPSDRHTIMNARRDFLKQLLFGRKTLDESFYKDLTRYDISFRYKNYCILMFKVSSLNGTLSEDGITQIFEEVLTDYECAYICDTGYDELSIIYNLDGCSEYEVFKSVSSLGNRLLYIMKQYFNQSVTVFVSNTHHSVSDVPLGYVQALQAFSMKNLACEETVVFFEKVMKNRRFLDYESFEKFIRQLEKAVSEENSSDTGRVLDELTDYVNNSKYIELDQIRYIIVMMIYIMNTYAEKRGLEKNMPWGEEESKYDFLSKLQRKEDFLVFLRQSKARMSEAMSIDDENHIVRSVKKYLRQNYRREILLKDVAEKHGITNTYLSMLFKSVTGETLKDHLTNLRIDKAKKLLRETSDQIFEISEAVGYDNEHYFSRIFKLKTLMTPTEYRNSVSK